MTDQRQIGVLLVAATAVLLANGCATSGASRDESSPPTLREILVERGLKPDEVHVPNEINDEMRAWLDERVRRLGSAFETLQELVRELQTPKDLKLTYDPTYTGTAIEVFESGQFNCLSFTHLFVGMARELGIEAYYLNVYDIETYRRDNDLVVRSGHVTAAYSDGPNQRVLEFTVGPEVDYRYTRPIEDLTAFAMYYSNRGAEELRAGEHQKALSWLEVAVRLDPQLADAWTNLGVARRRLGDLNGAEAAYQEAIRADSNTYSGYLNLITLYQLRGEKQAASKLLRLLDRRGNQNPYIFLALGDDSLAHGRFEDARRFYRKALTFSDEPAEALAALGSHALAMGERETASHWLARAVREDPQNHRVVKLAKDIRVAETG